MDYQIFTFLSSFSWFYLTMLSNLYLTLPVNFYVCLFNSYLFPIYFDKPISICKVLINSHLLSLFAVYSLASLVAPATGTGVSNHLEKTVCKQNILLKM
jgi:hypothetical protein